MFTCCGPYQRRLVYFRTHQDLFFCTLGRSRRRYYSECAKQGEGERVGSVYGGYQVCIVLYSKTTPDCFVTVTSSQLVEMSLWTVDPLLQIVLIWWNEPSVGWTKTTLKKTCSRNVLKLSHYGGSLITVVRVLLHLASATRGVSTAIKQNQAKTAPRQVRLLGLVSMMDREIIRVRFLGRNGAWIAQTLKLAWS